MTPVETLVLGINTSEPKCHSAQAANVLARDTLHALAPGFIRIFNGRCTDCNECFSPLLNDAALFPIGAANQSFPTAHERLRLAIERLVFRRFILHWRERMIDHAKISLYLLGSCPRKVVKPW